MGSSKSTTVQKNDPWGPASGPIQGAIPQVESLYQKRLGQQFFPGQTYAGFDPAQSEALSNIEGIARSGGGVTPAALGMVGDTLSGKYLDAGNPHFGLMAGRIRNEVQPALTAQWAKAGRGTGNMAAPEAIARGLGDAVGALAYQDYANERGNMFRAAELAPGLDAARYADSERLYGAGQTRQALDERRVAEELARYDFEQNREGNALAEKLGYLMPMAQLGGTSTSTTKSSMSPLQMIAGAAMTGIGLMGGGGPFSMMSMLPWMQKGMMGSAGMAS